MISILMPIYNGIEFIEESISSILHQTFTEWELIVGINGHQENSDVYKKAKDYENRDNRIKVIDFYNLKGKATTLNEMLKHTKYEWISLLDVDDKWLPNKLNSQIKYMENYDVIGTNCKYFGISNNSPKIPLGDLKDHDFLGINPIINSSCLLKKDLCYWDPKTNIGCNDYYLWLSLWKQNKTFFNVKSIEVLHRLHKNSYFNSKGNNRIAAKLRKQFKEENKNT